MAVPALSVFAANINPGPDGIWTSPTMSRVSYDEEDNDACFALEDKSFWFAHRNNCILAVLRLFPARGVFFDLGGGNGFVAQGIQGTGRDVVLLEPGRRGTMNARQRGIAHIIRSTVQDAGFFPDTLPAVGLFDVVEHIEDDRSSLEDIQRYVIPGGYLFLTVPASRWLWSSEDVAAGHYRRYSLRTLSDLVKRSGFEIEFASYLFSFLALPIFLQRSVPSYLAGDRKEHTRRKVQETDHVLSSGARTLIDWLSRRELGRISKMKPIRLGTSCLLVARKPRT